MYNVILSWLHIYMLNNKHNILGNNNNIKLNGINTDVLSLTHFIYLYFNWGLLNMFFFTKQPII